MAIIEGGSSLEEWFFELNCIPPKGKDVKHIRIGDLVRYVLFGAVLLWGIFCSFWDGVCPWGPIVVTALAMELIGLWVRNHQMRQQLLRVTV